MEVKIKKLHENSVIPTYAKNGDVGMDLTAVSLDIDRETGIMTYDTGLAFEIPNGYFGMVALRSSVYKYNLDLTNKIGIIDSGYRSSVKFKFELSLPFIDFAYDDVTFDDLLKKGEALYYPEEYNAHWKVPHSAPVYKIGDRVGQLIILPYPSIEFIEVDTLTESERGENGYGHTGN